MNEEKAKQIAALNDLFRLNFFVPSFGPRPIPGHGPHHYRFHVLALDEPIPDHVSTAKALLKQIAGHVLARGMLTGTYERP